MAQVVVRARMPRPPLDGAQVLVQRLFELRHVGVLQVEAGAEMAVGFELVGVGAACLLGLRLGLFLLMVTHDPDGGAAGRQRDRRARQPRRSARPPAPRAGRLGQRAEWRTLLAPAHFEHQLLERRVVGIAVPFEQVERVQLAEAERQLDVFDAHRQQLVVLEGARTFVTHERRTHRVGRPQHDDDRCAPQLGLDHGGELAAGRELAVPPDLQAAGAQRFGNLLGHRPVLARIADEDIGRFRAAGIHATASAFRPLRMSVAARCSLAVATRW